MAYNEPGPTGLKLALRKKRFKETDPETLQVNKPDLSTGTRPSPANRPGAATPVSESTLMKGNGLSKFNKSLDAITPYVSNLANALRKAPSPKMGKMVSAVSINSPSLEAERNEIDRSIRGVDRSADLNLDANSAAAVKAGNLIQGLRAKGTSWANQAQLGIQAQNQSASLNANIEAINASKVDTYQNQQIEANIANQRNQSANISSAADKRIGQLAVRDQMNLDKKKFGILSTVYGSGVLDRLVKKVGNGDTNKALGLDNFKLGGELEAGNSGEILKMGGRLKKLRRPNPLPPEMASNYRAFGGLTGDGGGDKKDVFQTQAELDEANALADGISRRRGLLPAHVGTKVGDTKPTWDIDPTLKGQVPKPRTFNVPNYVQRTDIQTENGYAWYTDPQSGNVVDIDMSVLNQPRFRVGDEQKALDLAKRSTALTRRSGGYINGTIRRMAKGKLRKIY